MDVGQDPADNAARQQVKDELAEKCQKLFLEFLEVYQSVDGDIKYLQAAQELMRPERNTLLLNFTDIEYHNQQLAS